MSLVINPAFKNLLPPLSAEERATLKASIITEGCRDPLIVWRGVIVDGHNRYEICQETGTPFKTTEMQFADDDSAMDWIDKNQLARRNLTPEQASLARGRRYNRTKKAVSNPQGLGGKSGKIVAGQNVRRQTTAETIARESGVTERTVRRDGKLAEAVERLAEKKPDLAKAIMAGTKRFKDVAREARAESIEEQKQAIKAGTAVVPVGVFDVVVIDPPWAYGREYDPETSRVANPYPEMNQDQLLELNPPFADNCVLFLWTTHAFIWDAKRLADRWGFTYKATVVWNKQKIGMGRWLRMQCEFCLVCIKGRPEWQNTTWRDIIEEPRREHSRKPEAFYSMVEAVTSGSRLDYFSREKRDGWEVFGNDTNRF